MFMTWSSSQFTLEDSLAIGYNSVGSNYDALSVVLPMDCFLEGLTINFGQIIEHVPFIPENVNKEIGSYIEIKELCNIIIEYMKFELEIKIVIYNCPFDRSKILHEIIVKYSEIKISREPYCKNINIPIKAGNSLIILAESNQIVDIKNLGISLSIR